MYQLFTTWTEALRGKLPIPHLDIFSIVLILQVGQNPEFYLATYFFKRYADFTITVFNLNAY